MLAQAPAPTPPASLQGAQQSFAEHRYEEAASRAGALAAAAADPAVRAAALLLEAKALVKLDAYARAEPVLLSYVDARPHAADGLYLLAYVLERNNKARESLAMYTRAAAEQRPTADDLKAVALDYVLLGDNPSAVKWLKAAVQNDPANEEAWYFLGRAQMQIGDFVEGEADFRRALALKPADSKALNNLGYCLAAQNRNEEAEAAYKQAVAAQAGTAHPSEQPLLNLGTLLDDANRPAEALPLLRQAAALAPGNVRCLEELARAEAADGKPFEAIQALQGALALEPKNPRLHFRLGQLLRRTGQTARADAENKLSTQLYGTHSSDQPR